MNATHIKAIGDYRISVTFDDDVCGVMDLSYLVQKGIFREMRDPYLGMMTK